MIAAFFAAFPQEVEQFYEEAMRQEEELNHYWDEQIDKLGLYVRSLGKKEAQELLLEVLLDGSEWQLERFLREHIG